MNSDPVASLRRMEGVTFGPPASVALFARMHAELGLRLPAEHVAVLQSANGILTFAGYNRLFGLYDPTALDAITWNDPECWKYAWPATYRDFWCFAETAWGDQFAYHGPSLSERGDQTVYRLDAFEILAEPEVRYDSFQEFFDVQFLGDAVRPDTDLTIEARRHFGPLPAEMHLMHLHHLAFGGGEKVENVEMMPARMSMLANGDLAMEIAAGPVGGRVKGLAPYVDTEGRLRHRILWV